MPLVPKFVGIRFEIRLDMLGPADAVEMVCPQCQRKYMIAPYQLLARFRPLTLLDTVSERFRCQSCGWKAGFQNKARWSLYTAQTVLKDLSQL